MNTRSQGATGQYHLQAGTGSRLRSYDSEYYNENESEDVPHQGHLAVTVADCGLESLCGDAEDLEMELDGSGWGRRVVDSERVSKRI
jgi:hypothetical protein